MTGQAFANQNARLQLWREEGNFKFTLVYELPVFLNGTAGKYTVSINSNLYIWYT